MHFIIFQQDNRKRSIWTDASTSAQWHQICER